MKNMRREVFCALFCVLLIGCATVDEKAGGNPASQRQAVFKSQSLPVTVPGTTEHSSVEALPFQSVYFVVVTRTGKGGRTEGISRGVAFSYERDGVDCVLVTASHVVQGAGVINVHVLMPDLTSGTGYNATVKWIDPTRDIAALRIRSSADCRPAHRVSDVAPLGQRIAAFLNTPQSRGMLSSGVVGGHWLTDVGPTIVCDMRVFPGHSGSPLLDGKGRLIGMVLSRTQSQEMSAAFALPTSEIDAAFKAQGLSPAIEQTPKSF